MPDVILLFMTSHQNLPEKGEGLQNMAVVFLFGMILSFPMKKSESITRVSAVSPQILLRRLNVDEFYAE